MAKNFGFERISDHSDFDGKVRDIHEYRYRLAGKYTTDDDVILDCACGTGYGERFLKGKYIGVDRFDGGATIIDDLHSWEADFDYDVFISFETIEHLVTYQQLVDNAKRAKRNIIVSAPTIPTVIRDRYGNPDIRHFHVNDFTFDQLKSIFQDDNWKIIYEEEQESRVGILILEKCSHS